MANGERWGRWQLIALSGLLVIVVVLSSSGLGGWLGSQVALGEGIGTIIGLVVGFLLARAMLRRLFERWGIGS